MVCLIYFTLFSYHVTCCCDFSKHYWRLIYFLLDDGVVLDSYLYAGLADAALQTAFDVTVTGYTFKYTDFLLLDVTFADFTSVIFEYKMMATSRVSPVQYDEVEIEMQRVWAQQPQSKPRSCLNTKIIFPRVGIFTIKIRRS